MWNANACEYYLLNAVKGKNNITNWTYIPCSNTYIWTGLFLPVQTLQNVTGLEVDVREWNGNEIGRMGTEIIWEGREGMRILCILHVRVQQSTVDFTSTTTPIRSRFAHSVNRSVNSPTKSITDSFISLALNGH
jgi:hypothetical protein